MTRGTMVVVFTDEDGNDYMGVSQEFNGDMGPDMDSGMEYGKTLYNDVGTKSDFNGLLCDMENDYGYDEDTNWDGENHFNTYSMNDDRVCASGSIKAGEIYRSIYNLSDYVYIKNLSTRPYSVVDKNGTARTLVHGETVVLDFGEFLDKEEEKEFVGWATGGGRKD